MIFLSTPSARRATLHQVSVHGLVDISIHALREEGDAVLVLTNRFCKYFYPRPPRGGRPSGLIPAVPWIIFLSTPSARRATPVVNDPAEKPELFLSTPSARRATARGRPRYAQSKISIHALHEEGDTIMQVRQVGSYAFLSTPSTRRATTALRCLRCTSKIFYPRPPRGGRPATRW